MRRDKPLEDKRLASIGLSTPDSAHKPVTRGEVLDVGPGRMSEHGVWLTMRRVPGERIVWDRDGAHEVPWDKDLVLVSDEYVLGTLEE